MNKQLIESLKTKSLVTPQRIEDHMNFSELSPKIIKISIDEKCQESPLLLLSWRNKQKQDSQKSLKHKIVANEISALKEKHIKLISETEMLCVDYWLLKGL